MTTSESAPDPTAGEREADRNGMRAMPSEVAVLIVLAYVAIAVVAVVSLIGGSQ